MTRYLVVFICCVLASAVNAQSDQIWLLITDVGQMPIEGATVQYDQQANAISDHQGVCVLLVSTTSERVFLQIKHVGYETLDTFIVMDQLLNDRITFVLTDKIFEVPEIYIKERVESIYDRQDWTVLDLMIHDENILVLNLQGSKRYLSISSVNGILKFESKLTEKYNRLHRGCLGEIQLVGPKVCRGIKSLDDSLRYSEKYSKESFNKLMLPCLFANEEGVFYQAWEQHNKLMTVHRVDQQSQANVCLQVYDKKAAKAAGLIYKKIISRYYAKTQSSKRNQITIGEKDNIIAEGSWDGDLTRLMLDNEMDQLVSYYLQVESKPLSIKHFAFKNTLYFINYENQEILKVRDCETNKLSKQNVAGLDWNNKKLSIAQDEATGKIYMLDEKDVLEMRITTNKIRLTKNYTLPSDWHHEDEFDVQNGQLYIACRPKLMEPKHSVRQVSLN